MKQALDSIWRGSNAGAPQAQRLEQAVWIIQDANGFRTEPFTITRQGPCNINGNLHAPQGAVAWVHTHPFATLETMTICGTIKRQDPTAPGGFSEVLGPNGQPLYPVYDNKPSYRDHELLYDVNATRHQLGMGALVGVILDANQTTVYTENPGDGLAVFPRCGY